MNINCVDPCHYQCDGKCMLNELPTFTQNTQAMFDMDCPYFTQTAVPVQTFT